MDRPARLPTTQEELDEWSVYADWLQTRGDPRGERIALELAVPEEPDPGQLAAFQAHVADVPPELARDGVELTFALGYIHTLRLACNAHDSVEVEALDHARALLVSEAGALVEELEVAFRPEDHLPQVQALLAALPLPCRRVAFDLCGRITAYAAHELAASLPPHVRELALSAHAPRPARIGITGMISWIDDRFDAIELRRAGWTLDHALDQLEYDRARLVQRAARTRRIRQQWTAGRAPFPSDRGIEIGRPGDAAVVDLRRRCAIVLSRWSRADLEGWMGPLPIRAWRARRLPEHHALDLYATRYRSPGSFHVSFTRRGDAWTVLTRRRRDGARMQVNGVTVTPDEDFAIGDRDRIHTERWSFALVTQDVTRTVRALLA